MAYLGKITGIQLTYSHVTELFQFFFSSLSTGIHSLIVSSAINLTFSKHNIYVGVFTASTQRIPCKHLYVNFYYEIVSSQLEWDNYVVVQFSPCLNVIFLHFWVCQWGIVSLK